MTVIVTCRAPDMPPLSVTAALITWVPAVSVLENDAPLPIWPIRLDVQRRPGDDVAILRVGRAFRRTTPSPLQDTTRCSPGYSLRPSAPCCGVVDEAVRPEPMFE